MYMYSLEQKDLGFEALIWMKKKKHANELVDPGCNDDIRISVLAHALEVHLPLS